MTPEERLARIEMYETRPSYDDTLFLVIELRRARECLRDIQVTTRKPIPPWAMIRDVYAIAKRGLGGEP